MNGGECKPCSYTRSYVTLGGFKWENAQEPHRRSGDDSTAFSQPVNLYMLSICVLFARIDEILPRKPLNFKV